MFESYQYLEGNDIGVGELVRISVIQASLTLRLPRFFCNTDYQGGVVTTPPLDFVFGFTYIGVNLSKILGGP